MFLVFVINSFMFNSDKAPIVLTAILLQLIYKFEYKMDQKTLQDLCGNITERTAVIKDWKSNHETICEIQIELEKYMGECGNKQDDCDSSNILFTIHAKHKIERNIRPLPYKD